MRVLVDGRSLVDASSFRGLGTYVREVTAGLAAAPGLEVSALVAGRPDLPPGVRRAAAVRRAPGRWATREHDLLLPLDLLRVPADVVWSPALDPPARCRRPWVQTLHDVLPALHDGPGRDAWLRRARRVLRADAVLTGSRWAADAAVEHVGVDPARVTVVHHGVHPRFRPADPAAEPGSPPYVLLVGEYDPRKRHDHAFAAVGALADAGLPHVLQVTGRIAPWYAGVLDGLVAAAPRPERVVLRDHVPVEELVRLYQGAAAVLMTSAGEGFGLPTVEAMACGTPVVAYDNTATGEVVADGGVLVPDGDLDAFSAALVQVVTDPQRRADLSARALRRAADFSWGASAAAHADVLRAVAGRAA